MLKIRVVGLLVMVLGGGALGAEVGPREWVDADTGHRVIRLSEVSGSRTLYFHDNAYTPEGDKLIFSTPEGVAVVDIRRLGVEVPKAEILTKGGGAMMARRSREVYVNRGGGGRGGSGGTTRAAGGQDGAAATEGAATEPGGGAVAEGTTEGTVGATTGPGRRRGKAMIYAVNVDTKAERFLPNAVSTTINCDETMGFVVARGAIDPSGRTPAPTSRPYVPQLERMFPGKKLGELTVDQQYAVQKEDRLAKNTLMPSPAAYTFIDLKSGERKTCGYQYGNLDHQQWSPTDPGLLLYAHEGTWHEVDRTWTIRSDGSGMRLMHKRTMDMEINGHEWWSFDGKMVWYDLQTPRSQDFWIGGVNVETGKETRYHIERDWWGVHFNSSRDNTMFADDGGDPTQVAFSRDGMWINLFRVQGDGTVTREKLVNMSKHNYVTGARGD